MRKLGALYSALLHLALLGVVYVGMPDWFEREVEPQPLVITLEQLPIAEETNVKPSPKPVVRERKDKPKPAKAKQLKTPPASKPKPKPQPKKVAPPKPKQTEKLKDIPKPKPEKAKPEPKVDELDEVLKNLREQARAGEADAKQDKPAPPAPNKTMSDAPYDPTIPLSLSERDAINSQFVRCWNIPAGSKDDYTLKVSIDVNLRRDASVVSAALIPEQRNRYAKDTVFRAAADSAVRAVHKCSPLKNLPQDKYGSWKELRLHFDPSIQLY